jgi:hypothetical protein
MREDILIIPTPGSHDADEVLTYAFIPPQNNLPQSAARSALQPVSQARIERNLDDVELNHSRDHEDDVVSVFSGEGLPGTMLCWYLIEGEDKDVLRLQSTVNRTIPKAQLGNALLAANEYHGRCRYGRCYFAINEAQTEARVFYESIIDLSEGVTDSYLQRFIMHSLFAAHVFFEMMHYAKLFAPVHPRKRSKPANKKEQSQPK